MVKVFETEHTFLHPFDRVTTAFFRKYPNDAASHVKAIDITDRRIDSKGQKGDFSELEGLKARDRAAPIDPNRRSPLALLKCVLFCVCCSY